jgi:hypothetical protein
MGQFQITTDPETAIKRAEDPVTGQTLVVLPDGESRIFKRRVLRLQEETTELQEDCWLVGELDGVRVYVEGNHIVMTRANLYP